MKRTILHKIPLLLLAFLFLTACQPEPEAEVLPPADVAQAVLDSQTELPDLEPLTPEDEAFSAYVEQYYQISADSVEDGILYYAGGVEASEIAVLTLTEGTDTAGAESALQDYITSRAGDFLGYVPAQAAMAEQGLTAVSGRTVGLFICPNSAAAQSAFLACFGETPPTTRKPAASEPPATEPPVSEETQRLEETLQPTDQPEETSLPETVLPTVPPETMPLETESPVPETDQPAETQAPVSEDFDPDAILEAWRSGGTEGLSEKNQLILDRCAEVIAANITDQMSEYEKELAIHDWMVNWAEYDPEANSHSPNAHPDPDNENPYGLMYQRVAICRGYSSTFQLFMDMLGIECITVEGSAYNRTEEHAWNMVRLDGEWYCVDVTWDDPTGELTGWSATEIYRVHHRFFNVTSQKLRDTDHQWDESTVPEATATAYGWRG